MSDISIALEAITSKQEALLKAEQYFKGEQPEYFASPKLAAALKNASTMFRLNYCAKVVNSVLDRVELAALDTGNTATDEALADFWADAHMELVANELHKWALVYGESYAIAWKGDDEGLEVAYNSPLTMHVEYDPEHPRKKLWAAKLWQEHGKTRLNMYYADTLYRYEAPKAQVKLAEDDFTLINEVETDFGEVPVFHFRTGRPPVPEHKEAYGPQDMINKLVVNQMSTSDFQAFPQRYALANPDEQGGGFEDDDDEYGPSAAPLTATPSGIWWLDPSIKAVGEFSAAQVDNFLKPIQQYIHSLAAVCDIPLFVLEGMRDAPSGEALRTSEQPLVKRVKSRQRSFTPTWQELTKFVLNLEGLKVDRVEVTWSPPESSNTTDAWEVADYKRRFGVPLSTVLREQGYPRAEAERIQAMSDGRDLDNLKKAAETLQMLSATAELGGLDDAQYKALVQKVVDTLDEVNATN